MILTENFAEILFISVLKTSCLLRFTIFNFLKIQRQSNDESRSDTNFTLD